MNNIDRYLLIFLHSACEINSCGGCKSQSLYLLCLAADSIHFAYTQKAQIFVAALSLTSNELRHLSDEKGQHVETARILNQD